MILKKIIIVGSLLIVVNTGFAQKAIDSLKQLLQTEKRDTTRVLLLNKLSTIYVYSKPDTALLLAHVTEESFLQCAQGERGYQHHARTRDQDRDGIRFPRAEKDGDLGRESAETRNAHRRGGRDDKGERAERQRLAQVHPGQDVEFAGVGAAINDATGDGEEESRNHAVRKHLENRAAYSERVRGREPEEDEAHVADTGITDDELEVALAQSDPGGINDPDDAEDGDPFTPRLKAQR